MFESKINNNHKSILDTIDRYLNNREHNKLQSLYKIGDEWAAQRGNHLIHEAAQYTPKLLELLIVNRKIFNIPTKHWIRLNDARKSLLHYVVKNPKSLKLFYKYKKNLPSSIERHWNTKDHYNKTPFDDFFEHINCISTKDQKSYANTLNTIPDLSKYINDVITNTHNSISLAQSELNTDIVNIIQEYLYGFLMKIHKNNIKQASKKEDLSVLLANTNLQKKVISKIDYNGDKSISNQILHSKNQEKHCKNRLFSKMSG